MVRARNAPAHTPAPYAMSSASWPAAKRTGSRSGRCPDQVVSAGPSSSEATAARRPQRRAGRPPGAASAAASTGAANWPLYRPMPSQVCWVARSMAGSTPRSGSPARCSAARMASTDPAKPSPASTGRRASNPATVSVGHG